MKIIYKNLDDGKGYIGCLLFRKCLLQGLWYESPLILKQIPRIGEKTAKILNQAGYKTFEKIINDNKPKEYENICNKNHPFGINLISLCRSVFRFIHFNY